MNNFCVFILTHGRPEKVITLETLKKLGYNGDVYLVIDNEDSTADEYYNKYGRDKVIMFDKLKISKEFDTGDNFDDRRTIVYARNACFKIAKDLGYKYFLELDDDYTSFMFRFIENNKLKSKEPKDINKIFESMIKFLQCDKITTVAFAQGGDFVGGVNGQFNKKVLRKAMNSFFCDVDKPFTFVGRINEDVNTYTSLGQRGVIMLTITDFMLNQLQTQSNKGGMTDVYLASGTYLKSFYSVMYSPSCVKVAIMNTENKRIHHKVNWNNCSPKILNERWKKW